MLHLLVRKRRFSALLCAFRSHAFCAFIQHRSAMPPRPHPLMVTAPQKHSLIDYLSSPLTRFRAADSPPSAQPRFDGIRGFCRALPQLRSARACRCPGAGKGTQRSHSLPSSAAAERRSPHMQAAASSCALVRVFRLSRRAPSHIHSRANFPFSLSLSFLFDHRAHACRPSSRGSLLNLTRLACTRAFASSRLLASSHADTFLAHCSRRAGKMPPSISRAPAQARSSTRA